MSSEWQEFQLDEICEFVNGFAFKPESYIDKSADTYEVFRMGYISRGGGFKEDSSPVFVSRSNPKLDKYRLRQGDIIIAMTDMKDKVAILGNTARVPEDNRFVLNQRAGLIRVSRPDLVCPVFLYYYSNWKPHVDYLRARANSGVQVNLSTGAIKEAKVFLPSVSEQRLIGEVLSSFDDRITLLRETNVTLEAIAQALFKSWFVDFDPVRAKMEGRTPEDMDEATAAIFPDSFEESELGLVPRGWGVGSIYEVAKVTYGAPFSSKLFKTEPPGKPLVRIRDLRDECPGVFTEEVHPKGYLLQPGDIVVGMDGEFRAYLWGGEEAWLNQRVCVFHPHNGASSAFVRLSIKPLLAAVEATETATTVIHLGKNDIDRFRVTVPSKRVLEAFAEVTGPLYDRLIRNKQQVQILSSLRDSLLPRLISGQLRLSGN